MPPKRKQAGKGNNSNSEEEREDQLWMTMVGRLLAFHEKNQNFDIPEDYTEVDSETHEVLYIGSWLSAQRDLFQFYFHDNPERYKILETLIFAHEPGLWAEEFGLKDKFGYMQDSEYFDIDGYQKKRRIEKSNGAAKSSNPTKASEELGSSIDSTAPVKTRHMTKAPSNTSEKPDVTERNSSEKNTTLPATNKNNNPKSSKISSSKPQIEAEPKPFTGNPPVHRLILSQSELHVSDFSTDVTDGPDDSSQNRNSKEGTFSLVKPRKNSGMSNENEEKSENSEATKRDQNRYIAFKYMKKQYGPFIGIGRIAECRKAQDPEMGGLISIIEICVMKPVDKANFFGSVFVEKSARRYSLPESTALLSDVVLVNGKLSDQTQLNIKELLEKNQDLKLAGL